MAGPSAIGSENGMPSSIRSAPADGRRRSISIDVLRSGSPAVTNVTRPPRACCLSAAKRRAIRCSVIILVPPVPVSLERDAEIPRGGEHVLVTSAAQIHQDYMFGRQCRSHPRYVCQSMGGFKRRDDPLGTRAQLESLHGLVI